MNDLPIIAERDLPAAASTLLSTRERATSAQRAASSPSVSAFVAASAGSGKTKLLTDRLLRLMLGGAEPARIQCLTFTKAAAAEMAIRLNRTLGEWVCLDDDTLNARLRDLEVVPLGPTRENARALFARVLDLPGGMRIGTIHAFCQSLLRRFPLEARLSPYFELIEDRDAEDALTEAREDMLANAHDAGRRAALDQVAGLTSLAGFSALVRSLRADPERLKTIAEMPAATLHAAQARALGIDPGDDITTLRTRGADWAAADGLTAAAETLLHAGTPVSRILAERVLEWLRLPPEDRTASWAEWLDLFLKKDGEPRAAGSFVRGNLLKTHADLAAPFLAEAARLHGIEDKICAVEIAKISAALVSLAVPVAAGYTDRKARSGLLDYDDLIQASSALLVDPGSAWVLYKLDGGLDHLLLDEVQDTAPAQWIIARRLAAEFFSGISARDTERTVFAVGDRKQSIYSVQGADAAGFERERRILAGMVADAARQWQDVPMDVSFRSTAPVLALVDAVFSDAVAAAGVVLEGETLRHYADRAGCAGSVELWPLAPPPVSDAPEPWKAAAQNTKTMSGRQKLAEALADWIAAQTDGSVRLEGRDRTLAPGDVLVLVRRRDELARALVGALKQRGVAVAGLDRLKLTEQPAVQDLLALADALLLPEDDLTLACVLTSPLGGLTDDSLMALAMQRPGSLWQALRGRAAEREDWRFAHSFFAALLTRADYVSPHVLLSEALGPLGGRARIFSRFGAEAAEPIDELLNAALAYGRTHPPSLQGFLAWLRRSGAEVKRQAEAAGDAVRVMTVHGAKGLQAPVVILPDTTALPPDEGALLWQKDERSGVSVPLWAPRKGLRCLVTDGLRLAVRQQAMEEHNRLLYVALTRAEDRLLICGLEPGRGVPETAWYPLIARGFSALGAEPVPFAQPGTTPWEGQALRVTSLQTEPPKRDDPRPGAAEAAANLPAWLGRSPGWRASPPPAEPQRPQRLAPSRPENAALGTVPAAASPLATRDTGGRRFRRGQLIHALLQHLPALPQTEWRVAARRFLECPGNDIAGVKAIADEVLAILHHPELAPLFGPGSRAEVPLTGVVAGTVIGGLVDRMAVTDTAILLADYKTNRDPPAAMSDTPVLYLRQMAAYRGVLRQVFPDRPVRCALIWTRTAEIVMLADALLDAHQPRATSA